jgi:hypothetical protein
LYTSNLFNWRFRSQPANGTQDATTEL